MEDVTLQEMVVWVGYYVQEKGGMEFDWHQVASKNWIVGKSFGRCHDVLVQ